MYTMKRWLVCAPWQTLSPGAPTNNVGSQFTPGPSWIMMPVVHVTFGTQLDSGQSSCVATCREECVCWCVRTTNCPEVDPLLSLSNWLDPPPCMPLAAVDSATISAHHENVAGLCVCVSLWRNKQSFTPCVRVVVFEPP